MRWVNDVHGQGAIGIAVENNVAQQTASGGDDKNVRGVQFNSGLQLFVQRLVSKFQKIPIDKWEASLGIVGVVEFDHEVTFTDKIVNNGVVAIGADPRCCEVCEIYDGRRWNGGVGI